MEGQEFKAEFVGVHTTIGNFKIKNKDLYMEKKHMFSFIYPDWRFVCSNNKLIDLELYEEIPTFNPLTGKTSKIRRYYTDLKTMSPYVFDKNKNLNHQINVLSAERDIYASMSMQLKSMLETATNLDMLKKEMKDQWDFFNNKLIRGKDFIKKKE